MSTMPLTQRLYDKNKSDLAPFRNDMGAWSVAQGANGFEFSGSIVDVFWEKCRGHLREKVTEYFEWMESESSNISPSACRRIAIEQCVGAVVAYGGQVREISSILDKRLRKAGGTDDSGNWIDLDDKFIFNRGEKLIDALGLNKGASLTVKLNNFVGDHKWLPMVLSILSLLISVSAFLKE